ncbi:MAG TPA: cytochrome c oxidase accessory protein CcoG [Blastocatellia bacterium]|nr:cytochrome c oxidase accessory protein CcoG [Blastocatellia bacterium]
MSIINAPVGTADGFREHTASIAKDGTRRWIFPRRPSGRLYRARTIVSIFLLAFLFGAPLIKVNGQPFMLFNIIERKFVFFGLVFLPQDFYIVVLGALTMLVSIFLFTSVMGRVWCGWMCPQTIFLEMLFRKIEYLIDGDNRKQRQLADAPMSPKKLFKRLLKNGIFFALSFLIANTFLAYIIGIDQLWQIITDSPVNHLGGLFAITVFSLAFFFVFAWFREQACVVVCPYGRYQSALVDENTIVVAYDFKRGEPRGKLIKIDPKRPGSELPKRGDCIDCRQCVEVCPTGIDIRNGIQLECVNCTACIDACNGVMDKIKKPRGLIRYSSHNAIKEGKFKWLTPCVIGYAGVWVLITSIFLYFFLSRPMAEVLVLRQPGTLSQTQADGSTVNFYVLQVANKHTSDVPIELKLIAPQQGAITPLGQLSPIPRISVKDGRFLLALPKSEITSPDMKVKFGVYSNGKLLKEVETRFLTAKSQ